MTLQKQPITLNFGQGLDTKTDPNQVQVGNFLALQNSVFTKGNALTKRNGYKKLPPLTGSEYLTTFNADLTSIGTSLQAFSTGINAWVDRGRFYPLNLDTLPLIRNNTNQSQADTTIAPNGLICTVYTDQNPANLATKIYRYAIADSITGQNIVEPTTIPTASTNFGTPKVFLLGNYFIIVFTALVVGVYHLQYIAISINNPSLALLPATISTSVEPSTTVSFDGFVFNNVLYLAWNGAAASGVKMAYLTAILGVSSTVIVDAAHSATLMSVTADATNSIIWASYYDFVTKNGYTVAVNPALITIQAPVQYISGINSVLNVTSVASNGVITEMYEVSNNYSYDAAIPTHFVQKRTVNLSAAVSPAETFMRSVGLASKAFMIGDVIYCLVVHQSPYQSTYFLVDVNAFEDEVGAFNEGAGAIIAKLAYGNAGGYLITGLPSVTVTDNLAQVSYLIKDSIQSVNKNTNVPAGSQVAGVYSQLGINLVSFTIGTTDVVSSEIGANLNISGGFLWAYDGYSPVEQGFFVYPDSVRLSAAGTGSGLTAQPYFYQVTYEWTDNQGNAFRSAPSIPVSITPAAGQIVTINVPTLRLTYKTANPVKIVVYRWSQGQQSYYQVTSITLPILNNPLVDSVAIIDTLSDGAILGNNLLYTTGGVVENIGPPATSAITLFDDRLWLVDAEDKNLLWFSKQVIEATPVEMSDLFTLFVASTLGATAPTGPITALSAMDDKLIIFKNNACYYLNGTGPDNTGANNQYSQPTFITSMVGCSNQNSIVFQTGGLMFEFKSESGSQIWLLSRDLQTSYIGAPVEALTKDATVLSSIAVPGTNQVRFNLSSGITLMYDYFYGQWGTFSNDSVSSTLFEGLHTFLAPIGTVYQETPQLFLDGSNPVLMSFETSWIKLAGLKGYQRAYFFYLLGKYLTPFKLTCAVSYDYESAPISFSMISPTNFSPNYGSDESNGQESIYGQDTPYGGPGNVLNWRMFFKKQRCSSFKIHIQEIYDPSFSIPAGEGLSLSGILVVAAIKSGFKTISSRHTVGGS